MTAVRVVPFVTLIFEADIPPKFTVAPATKFVPVTVTEVPPAAGPEFGETPVTVGAGAGAEYVNPPARVPLCPLGLATTTLTIPAACAGVIAVIVVLFTTLTFAAAAPPIVTVAPATKFVPVIVTDVPPAVVPVFGEIDVTVGAPLPPPPDFGKIVESFFSAPGAVFR